MSTHRARTRRTPLRLLLAGALALGGVAFGATAATAGSGAISTTTNVTTDDAPGNGACLNGGQTDDTDDVINCNHYKSKADVWLSGLPASAALEDGYYFFAVVNPGSQDDVNDGAAGNLSDGTDADGPKTDGIDHSRPTRTFQVTGGNGTIIETDTTTHAIKNNKIQLIPYDDTENLGGVYILAVCQLASADSTADVDPSKCKYDAFKVVEGDEPEQGDAVKPTIDKTAAVDWTQPYSWSIEKDVDKTLVQQVGGTATLNYSVSATRTADTPTDATVSGTITVTNLNVGEIQHATITDDVEGCTIDGATTDISLHGYGTAEGANTFSYSCELGAVPTTAPTNSATVTWPEQVVLGGAEPLLLEEGQTSIEDVTATMNEPTSVNDCVSISDVFDGGTPTVLVDPLTPLCHSTGTTPLTYSKTVNVPSSGCRTYNNTATFTTDDSQTSKSASKSVQACGPVKTGARTIGFWGNNNGQRIITAGAASGGVCSATTYLRTLKPFTDAPSSCADLAGYFAKTFTAGTANNSSMAAMLKLQMLSTALDVYFTGDGAASIPDKYKATIGVRDAYGVLVPLGDFDVDLTKVCRPGVSSCTAANWQNVSEAFGANHLTVKQMLCYSSSQYSLTNWYGLSSSATTKPLQEKAKNAYDAINNEVAFKYIPVP